MNRYKNLFLATLLACVPAFAEAESTEIASEVSGESEFMSDERLQDGFVTHLLNNAIEKQMSKADGSASGKEEKMTFGRKITKYVSAPKFGGYIIGSYKYNSQEGQNNGPGFGVRLVRVYVDGTIFKDFKYRLQVELNGNPHLKDYFIDWTHWKEFGVKIGQFKRSFTFENPYNPWDVGVGDYSQLSKKFAGFGDYCGEASMGGRDQGLQVHGDLFPIGKDKHRLLHYELGIYNGQGINATDKNKRKDIIGTLQVQPIKDLFVGFFGWNGNTVLNGLTVDRKRWGVGVKYEHNDWSVRGEFVKSKGKAVKSKAGEKYIVIDTDGNEHQMQGPTTYFIDESTDKADAWYMTVGVPCTKWLKVYGKYDAYRSNGEWNTLKTIYSVCPNFQIHKNLMLQLQYNYVHDKTAADRDYHEFWVETYVRF